MNWRASGTVLSTAICFCVVFAIAACKNKKNLEVQNTRSAQSQSVNQNPTQPPSVQPPASACTFEWVDPKNQASIWQTLAAAFHQELLPDRPSNDPGVTAYSLKRILRVARCGDAVIIVLENKTGKKEEEDWNRLYALYNFNLASKAKSGIEAKWPFWLWRFRQVAHFEDNSTPDILFESYSCTECEPEIILSALRFDSKAQKWELREWPKGDKGIALVNTAAYMDVGGSGEEYQTMSAIGDFDGSGHDEVAVWMHYRDVNEKDPNKLLPVVTTLSLFGYQEGRPVEKEVKNEAEMARIKRKICQSNPSHDACKEQNTR